MYEMFSFELPWQRGSGDGLAAMNHGQSEPTPLTKHCPNLHPTIQKVIARCLVPDPANRMQSMKEVLTAITPLKHEDVNHPDNDKK